MKKVAILGAVVVLLGCSAATVADDHKSLSTIEDTTKPTIETMSLIIETSKTQTRLEQEAAEALQKKIDLAEYNKSLLRNKEALGKRLDLLEKYVGKT